MKIDFHYYTIKLLAEKAGFPAGEAQTIAYASQYVDDATEYRKIHLKTTPDLNFNFERLDGEYFDPVCTAHKGVQLLNSFKKSVQRKIYISFHFIPPRMYNGNGKYDFHTIPDNNFINRYLSLCIKQLQDAEPGSRTRKLIKLGIALHSYADTWAHQGFSGRHSARDNDIERISIYNDHKWMPIQFIEQLEFNAMPDIGHAEAVHFPDESHLTWKYKYSKSKTEVIRDNTLIFLDAAQAIFRLLCSIQNKEPANQWQALENKLLKCFRFKTKSLDEKVAFIQKQFPSVEFDYNDTLWKKQALKKELTDSDKGIRIFSDRQKPNFKEEELKWFYFHSEALEQRKFVMKHIKHNLA